MNEINETAVAVQAALYQREIKYRLDNIEETLAELQAGQKLAADKMIALDSLSNRWKGAFLVILGLGTIIGGIIALAGNVWKFFK